MEKMPSDDALAEMALQDVNAFATLYRRHLQRVYSYLLSRVRNVQDAQDLTTQTFVAALHSLDKYEPRGLFCAWLLGIAKRKLSDYFRAQKVVILMDEVSPLADNGRSLDDIVIERLQMQEITKLLEHLNPERAEALRLRYFAELKLREIAELMDKSEGAVKMLLARGLDDMRDMLIVPEGAL